MAARKQKAKPTETEKSMVEGVDMSMLKVGVFNQAYVAALAVQKAAKKPGKVVLPPDGTPMSERVKAFVLWNRATTAVDKLSGCSSCGGDSSIELEMCPYCGDHEIVDATGNVVAGNSAVTETPADEPEDTPDEAPAPDPEPAPSSPPDEPAAEQPQTPKRVKKPRQQAAQEPASQPPAAAPAEDPPGHAPGPVAPAAADPLPPGGTGRKLRSAGRASVLADHAEMDAGAAGAMDRDRDPEPVVRFQPGVKAPAASKAAITTTAEVIAELPAAGFTAADLDKSVQLITTLKRSAADSLWKLGQAIKNVLDHRLWMLRIDTEGAPKYRTFKQFVVGELDMSYMQAHRLVQVSEGFTEQEMHQIGVSKCHVMLQVPKDVRAGLLASAERGATLTQISNEVAKMTEKERPKALTRTAPQLTVAMAEGRVELPLFARPKGRHGYASEAEQKANPRPATSITDDPFCSELLANDVLVTYNIAKNLDGSWLLIVQRRRAKETEVFADDGDEEDEE